MYHIFFSSITLSCFILFFLSPNFINKIPNTTHALTSHDILNQTCNQCAADDESSLTNYNFCITSLQPIPISHATNVEGLALLTMDLALQNATATISTIDNLLRDASFDVFGTACLDDCLDMYSDAVYTLVDGVGAFLIGDYNAAILKVSAGMDAARTCEKGFLESGEDSPLTKENYNLFQLGDVALCITELLINSAGVIQLHQVK